MAHGNVGMVGLGIMGSAISANLLDAGWDVIGYDINPARTAQLRVAGGTPAASVAAVAADTQIVLTSLPSVSAFESSSPSLRNRGATG